MIAQGQQPSAVPLGMENSRMRGSCGVEGPFPIRIASAGKKEFSCESGKET
jgi:hypothetical protein